MLSNLLFLNGRFQAWIRENNDRQKANTKNSQDMNDNLEKECVGPFPTRNAFYWTSSLVRSGQGLSRFPRVQSTTS